MRTNAFLIVAALVAGLFPVHGARADVRVTGEVEAIQLDVSDAPVEEVLNALGSKFGLHYRSTTPLGRRITGTHEGSLQRVLARVLDGYDYVLKSDADGIEVAIYGAGKPDDARTAAVTTQIPRSIPANVSSAKSRHEARRKRHAN